MRIREELKGTEPHKGYSDLREGITVVRDGRGNRSFSIQERGRSGGEDQAFQVETGSSEVLPSAVGERTISGESRLKRGRATKKEI